MLTIYRHENGETTLVDAVDPAWLKPDSGVSVWVDLDQPDPEESQILRSVFHFHELAVEDALAALHHPKIESYGDYLYLILHGIDFSAREHEFATQDVDFFLGERYLVTVHPGVSRSIGKVGEVCVRNARVLGEGPAALMHRIVDTMVDNYRPEVEKLEDRLDELEKEVFEQSRPAAGAAHPRLQARRLLAAPRRPAAARRGRPARPARVPDHHRDVVLPLPRRLRSPRAA